MGEGDHLLRLPVVVAVAGPPYLLWSRLCSVLDQVEYGSRSFYCRMLILWARIFNRR